MEKIISFMDTYSEIINVFSVVFGAFGITIFALLEKNEKVKKYKWICFVFVVVSVLVVGANNLWKKKYTKVPEISECSLDTAKMLLDERGLSYRFVNDEQYANECNPFEEAYIVSLSETFGNTYVERGTEIELKILGLKSGEMRTFIDNSVDFDDLYVNDIDDVDLSGIASVDVRVCFGNMRMYLMLYGGQRTPFLSENIYDEPDKLYLYNTDYCLLFKDYDVGTNMDGNTEYVFKGLPEGNYALCAKIDGFIEYRDEFVFTKENAYQNNHNISIGLIPQNEKETRSFSIKVVDDAGNPIKNKMCLFRLHKSDIPHGMYTDEEGIIGEYGFEAVDETKVLIDVEMNEDGTDNHRTTLKVKDDTTYILVVSNTGKANILTAEDYYDY